MKRHILSCLVLLNLVLASVLASLWVDQSGQLINVHWVPPSPVKADMGSVPVGLTQASEADVSMFMAILDRPLFSPSRRQPPPPPPPAPPPPPDPFATLELYGVFSGEGGSGIIASLDGKVRRMKVNDLVGTWTVKSIDDRDVTFTTGDQTRVVKLVPRKKAPPKPPSPVAANPVNGVAGSPFVGGNTQMKQQLEDEARERVRYLNQVRAKAGLPPLPP